MENKTDKILVGRIVAPQGLRGDVRAQAWTTRPSDFSTLPVFSEKYGVAKFVRAVPGSDIVIVKFDGINDRNTAETLRGVELFVLRDDLPVLPSGEFYYADLIGMNVVGHGKVVDIKNFGAGDILELDNGEMIHFSSVNIDRDKREIQIKE
ncbi:MAG: ribosome maturation factor RimM [Rickettsiales bacterium]|nr:ribosome maturation factor RimM [Rickettsiales bacterium]